MNILRKTVFWVLIALFIAFAAVQYNDTDGWLWMMIYLLSGFLCFRALKKQGDRFSYLAVATLFILWAINQFPPSWEGVMLNTAGMKTLNIELGRESIGLAICSLAMLICGIWD